MAQMSLELKSGSLAIGTIGVLAGSAISTAATRFAAARLWEPQIPGGEAIYSVALAFLLTKVPTPSKFVSWAMAVGSLTTGGSIVFDAIGGN